jgi:hypothetical protein
MKITHRLILPVAALVASATLATAQEQNNQQRPPGEGGERREGDRGRGGDRGGFSMEEFRKRMEERLKGALKVSDEEWAVLQPLIEKVQTKQREAMGARFGGFGGGPGGPPGGFPGFGDRRRGPDGGGGAPDAGGERRRGPDGGGDRGPGGPGSPGGPGGDRGGSPESQALRTTLENENASADEIKAKLTALRDSRKKAAAELDAARAELQKVVTVRQEAVLVAMGMLE